MEICQKFNPLYLCRVGSIVYGTNQSDSDEDFLLVSSSEDCKRDLIRERKRSYTVVSRKDFINGLNAGNIFFFEALLVAKEHHIIDYDFKYKNFHKKNVFAYGKQKAEEDFRKAEKIISEMNYVDQKSRKRIFHSLRILRFTKELLESRGSYINYSCLDLFLNVYSIPENDTGAFLNEVREFYEDAVRNLSS